MSNVEAEVSERERNRKLRPPTPPRWQSHWHNLYTLTFCTVGIFVPIHYLDPMRPLDWVAIPVTFVIANFVEYAIHRWPMHRKYPGAKIMLDLHMIHHNYFYEDTYKIGRFEDFAMIVFPPIVLNILAFGLVPVLGGIGWWLFGKNTALLFFVTVMGYYLLMQLIHVLCHLDEKHWIVSLPGIHYLWVHHKIHHTKSCMTKVNFNFIVPLADLVIGTSSQDKSLMHKIAKSGARAH